jgi:DNA-binding NtrC family response regulator
MADAELAHDGSIIVRPDGRTLADVLRCAERAYILSVMIENDGNTAKAADAAGLSIQAFRRRLRDAELRQTWTL